MGILSSIDIFRHQKNGPRKGYSKVADKLMLLGEFYGFMAF